jgi:hypothetical protein
MSKSQAEDGWWKKSYTTALQGVKENYVASDEDSSENESSEESSDEDENEKEKDDSSESSSEYDEEDELAF